MVVVSRGGGVVTGFGHRGDGEAATGKPYSGPKIENDVLHLKISRTKIAAE